MRFLLQKNTLIIFCKLYNETTWVHEVKAQNKKASENCCGEIFNLANDDVDK